MPLYRSLKNAALLCAVLLPTTALADWNGPYGGLSFGAFDGEVTFTTPGITFTETFSDSNAIGGFVGYQLQNLEGVVYGGELSFGNAPSAEFQPGEVLDPFIDVKGRIGMTQGNFLLYGVAGASFATYDENGNPFEGVGLNFGAGADYRFSDQLFAGIEFLTRRTSGDYPENLSRENTFDLNVSTISLRVGVNF